MIRKEQPTMSSKAPEEESAPGGQARAEQGGKETVVASQRSHSEKGFFCADWQRKWKTSLGRATNNEHRPSGSFRESTAAWLREQGDWNGSKAINEDWVLLEGRACEIARAQEQLDLQQTHEQGTVNEYLQTLRQRGYVGLANAGLTILEAGGKSMREQDRRQHQDQVSVWMTWLDWAVRFVRPSWEANVTTWNLGPLGYEYSRNLLQQLLKRGQAVVMVQEMRFPLGARQRVKNELKHLHPEYHCLLEAGKDPLPSDEESMDTERLKNPWCNRGHFAVATFLHRGVFKSAQRREWHVDADTKTLRHMTRGRVLRVDAELHDGQRLQVFNVHQAT